MFKWDFLSFTLYTLSTEVLMFTHTYQAFIYIENIFCWVFFWLNSLSAPPSVKYSPSPSPSLWTLHWSPCLPWELSRGEGSPPLTCWQWPSSCSPGGWWPSSPPGCIAGSGSACCPLRPPQDNLYFPSSHSQACTCAWGLFLARGRTLHFPLLNFMRSPLSNSPACQSPPKGSMTIWCISCSSQPWIVWKLPGVLSSPSSKSLMKIFTSTGPTIDPWGSLPVTGLQLDLVPLTTTPYSQ